MAKWAKFFQVSRSGYYAYIERHDQREQANKHLKAEVRRIFDGSGGTYGPGRICGVLRKSGRCASYPKISSYMAE